MMREKFQSASIREEGGTMSTFALKLASNIVQYKGPQPIFALRAPHYSVTPLNVLKELLHNFTITEMQLSLNHTRNRIMHEISVCSFG